MNLEKIGQLAATVVVAAAITGHLDKMNHWVQVATAKVVWESRTSTWGSPRFFTEGYRVSAHARPQNRSEKQIDKTTTDHRFTESQRSKLNGGEQ